MAKKGIKKEDPCDYSTDAQEIDELIFNSIVGMSNDMMEEAHKRKLCPHRLVERLSVNLNLFMATMIEGVHAKAKKSKAKKGK